MATGAELNADGSSKLAASAYQELVGRIQGWVQDVVPADEATVVVSRGDESLLQLGARPSLHFPRLPDGRYAGHHPADSDAAVAELEGLREQGAAYLVLPNTAFWWLDFYDGFARHLQENYETVLSNDDCRIYRLLQGGPRPADTALVGSSRIPVTIRANGRILSQFLDTILPSGARTVVLNSSTAPVPSGTEAWQPPPAAITDQQATADELVGLARRGVEFLVIPSTAFDWVKLHPALAQALRAGPRLVTRQKYICEIYELNAAPIAPAPVAQPEVRSEPPRPRSTEENPARAGRPSPCCA